ncbi:MAG TPA: DUF3500 domain-containing protein [Chitinophagaceae bacterium]|nr:DUF3500 domain-containing protein [Chitinophagaceae bacterium]
MKYILIICLCILVQFNAVAQSYGSVIRKTAVELRDSLTELQKKRVTYDIGDSARIKWNNLPVGLRARAGISIGSMTESQRHLLHRLLSVSLSSQGYLKSTSIFHLDNLLNIMYDSLMKQGKIKPETYKMLMDLQWSHQNFYLAFFGDPASDKQWGYKIEGHHLSLNFSFVNDKIAVTPMFMGTDPAEYPTLEYAGWRVLGQEEDLGINLINILSETQRKKATLDTLVPRDIITGAETGRRLINYWGLKGKEMNEAQKKILTNIIREYVFNLEWDKANEEFNKILKAGIDNVYFGWIGSYDEHQPHYFLLNGPSFLIEFDNARNHIHTIWREKGNEYGEDLLKQHYMSSPHK